MSTTIFVSALWTMQLIVMAIFDTRKDILNKLLNWSVLLTSLIFTFFALSWVWLIIPILIVPILAGLLGGTVGGLWQRHKKKDDAVEGEVVDDKKE